MTPQNVLHLVKLKEFTFQMSQDKSCATNDAATARLADFVTHTDGRTYFFYVLAACLYIGERVKIGHERQTNTHL